MREYHDFLKASRAMYLRMQADRPTPLNFKPPRRVDFETITPSSPDSPPPLRRCNAFWETPKIPLNPYEETICSPTSYSPSMRKRLDFSQA